MMKFLFASSFEANGSFFPPTHSDAVAVVNHKRLTCLSEMWVSVLMFTLQREHSQTHTKHGSELSKQHYAYNSCRSSGSALQRRIGWKLPECCTRQWPIDSGQCDVKPWSSLSKSSLLSWQCDVWGTGVVALIHLYCLHVQSSHRKWLKSLKPSSMGLVL
jgi:hypothetical protein